MKTRSIILLVVLLFAFAFTLTACSQHIHEWEDATCEAPKTCKSCGATEGEALGHVEEDVAEQAATCTEAGHTAGKKCSVCGEVISGMEEIPAAGHAWDDGEITTPATCCTEGVKTYTCTVDGCGETKTEPVAIDDDAHEWNDGEITTNPTCTTAGVKTYTCTVDGCGETKTEPVAIDDDAHEWNDGEITTNPTCTTAGVKTYTCTHNSAHTKTEPVAIDENAHAWNEGAITTPATCKAEGVKTYTCTHNSAHTKTEAVAIDENAHNDSTGDYKCDNADAEGTVCGALLCAEHQTATREENRSESTCTKAGSYELVTYCTECNTVLNRETKTLELAAHTEEIIPAVAPTCTEDGKTAGKMCSVCEEVLEAPQVDGKTGHDYKYVWAGDMSTCTATCQNGCSNTETATVSVVTLSVSGEEVTFTYKVEFVNSELAPQSETINTGSVEIDGNVAKINAPAIAGRVASHDYIKVTTDVENYTFDIYYSEVDVWDGISVSTSLSGTGDVNNPYLIQSGADLAYLKSVIDATAGAQGSNYKVKNFVGKYFKMTKSIDLDGADFMIGYHKGWNEYEAFSGIFDGNNCTIRGLNINPANGGSAALFACVSHGGLIKNLSLYGKVNGASNVASLVAYLVHKSSVENVTNYATVTATGGTVGGIVANQEGGNDAALDISNCVNYGTVTTTSYIVGGIAGSGGAAIKGCTNWADITGGDESIGGIAGTTKAVGTISNCYNYGSIKTTAADKGKIGGIAGNCLKPVSNCVNYGEINGAHTTGGICGVTDSAITDCVNNGTVTVPNCDSTVDGISPSNVDKTGSVNNGSVVIPSHTMTYHAAVAAGCETAGNVEYWACSVCQKNYGAENGGNVIANVVLAAKGHAWDEGVLSEDGSKLIFTCGNDSDHTREETANYTVTVNHLYINGSVAAEAETLTYAYDSIQTINAKTIDGYVASHDYVKVHMLENKTVTIYYSEVDVWDGTSVSSGFSGGTGTQDDPYLISSGADLAYLKSVVNAHNVEGTYEALHATHPMYGVYSGKYFKLTKSIDVSKNANFVIGYYSGWNNYSGFAGILDGNNCTIRGLNITQKYGALFGAIAKGTVKNLSVYGSASSNSGYVAGVSTHLLKAGTIDNVTNYVNVSCNGTGTYLGGIVCTLEENGGTINNCVNYGTITSTGSSVGGIAGCARAKVTNCVNWGNVSAGISDTSNNNSNVGGIFGFADKAAANISSCTNYGTVTGTGNNVGGVYGVVWNGTVGEDCVDKSAE